MGKYHVIVDFSYLYYKYFFRLQSADNGRGYLQRLSAEVDGTTVDTTYLFYISKEIESFRENILKHDPSGEITVSICFDSKSDRKEEDTEYKADRVSKLSENDFDNHRKLKEFYEKIGYNTYKIEGKEADDIVYNLVHKYKSDFDYNVIYTPDKDLMINVCDNVCVMRSSTFKAGYEEVNIKNYESYLAEKLKCRVPYNSILLYLSMVGDKVDGISGIKGFGHKAFDTFVKKLDSDGFDFKTLADKDVAKEVLEKYVDDYKKKNEEALEQALKSLKMAEYREFDVEKPDKKDTKESRNEMYSKYKMNSLVK